MWPWFCKWKTLALPIWRLELIIDRTVSRAFLPYLRAVTCLFSQFQQSLRSLDPCLKISLYRFHRCATWLRFLKPHSQQRFRRFYKNHSYNLMQSPRIRVLDLRLAANLRLYNPLFKFSLSQATRINRFDIFLFDFIFRASFSLAHA